jgi:hypothetical protein
MEMASRDSVTVSIAAETMGMESSIPGAICVTRLTSLGITSEYDGTSSTSSKVNPIAMSGIAKENGDLRPH